MDNDLFIKKKLIIEKKVNFFKDKILTKKEEKYVRS
jgi:hypothetical protein